MTTLPTSTPFSNSEATIDSRSSTNLYKSSDSIDEHCINALRGDSDSSPSPLSNYPEHIIRRVQRSFMELTEGCRAIFKQDTSVFWLTLTTANDHSTSDQLAPYRRRWRGRVDDLMAKSWLFKAHETLTDDPRWIFYLRDTDGGLRFWHDPWKSSRGGPARWKEDVFPLACELLADVRMLPNEAIGIITTVAPDDNDRLHVHAFVFTHLPVLCGMKAPIDLDLAIDIWCEEMNMDYGSDVWFPPTLPECCNWSPVTLEDETLPKHLTNYFTNHIYRIYDLFRRERKNGPSVLAKHCVYIDDNFHQLNFLSRTSIETEDGIVGFLPLRHHLLASGLVPSEVTDLDGVVYRVHVLPMQHRYISKCPQLRRENRRAAAAWKHEKELREAIARRDNMGSSDVPELGSAIQYGAVPFRTPAELLPCSRGHPPP